MLTLMAHLNSSADAAAWKNRCHVENQEKKPNFTDVNVTLGGKRSRIMITMRRNSPLKS